MGVKLYARWVKQIKAFWCFVLVEASVSSLMRPRAASGGSPSASEKEYAFEMATSTIRYGPGVTKEVGMDVQNLGIKKLGVFTDKNVSLEAVTTASLLCVCICVFS